MMRFSIGLWGASAICAGLWANPAVSQVDSYSEVVVFGDSLSDVGNTANNFWINLVSPQAQPPYFDGRFSNGPVWVEHLANSLGLEASVRSGAGGLNYAQGGALADNGTNFLGLIDNLGNQVDHYLDDHTPTGNELFIVWGGANDLIESGSLFSGDGTPQSVSTSIALRVETLASAGAQNILVLNLPDLGDIPRYLGTSEQADQSAVSQQFNALLENQIDTIQNQYAIDIDLLDIDAMFGRLLDSPERYGFTNVTDSAFNGSTVVADPTGYVFWDDIHPTALAHEWIATAARIALMEAGDITGDGFVGAEDFDVLLAHWGQSATPYDLTAGDLTGDGYVGQADLDRVISNWSSGTPPTQVPEPSSAFALVLLGLLANSRSATRARVKPQRE